MPAENRTLLLRHSCRENLAFHGRLQGIPESDLYDRIDTTLEMVGLGYAADRVGYALSSGMLARLMLARAILHDPPVLILDEPTGAVDPIGSYELLGLIQNVAAERKLAVLISSHRLDEVEMLDDTVLLLDKGNIVFSGRLVELLEQGVRPSIEITFDADEAASVAATHMTEVRGIDRVDTEGARLRVETALSIGAMVSTMDGHIDHVVSIETAKPRLRDVLNRMLRPGDQR
jgi:ABC-2 type transport system ATP-binding protein